MDESNYDLIVIGGGHNGLVCAFEMARAGRKVLVLERRKLLRTSSACCCRRLKNGWS